jgi:hypothetical protein
MAEPIIRCRTAKYARIIGILGMINLMDTTQVPLEETAERVTAWIEEKVK